MINLKTLYKRHINEVSKVMIDDESTLFIINKNSTFKNFIKNDMNFILVDNKNLLNTFNSKKLYNLVVLTDVYEQSDDVYELLLNCQKILTNDGKIIVSSLNSKWYFILRFFELIKVKKFSDKNVLISKKKSSNVALSSGLDLIHFKTRQIIPFSLFGVGSLVNNLLELFLGYFNLGFFTYAIYRKSYTLNSSQSKSIIIPAKNEEKNLEILFNRMPVFENHTQFIIVCGKSKDNTEKKALEIKNFYKELDIEVINQSSNGKSNAVWEALELTTGDLIAILDSDLSVDPETLPTFFSIIESNKADFVNGTRLFYKMEEGAMRILNTFGNKFFQSVISFIVPFNITDSLCGTKVFKSKYKEKIYEWKKEVKVNDPFGDFDLLFTAAHCSDKVLEYPVHYRSRIYGSTQISRFRDGYKLIIYFLFSLVTINSSKN